MQKCATTDFEFKVPDSWQDKSMISFVAPPSPGQKIYPNILVGKDTLQRNETLDRYVNRQLKDVFTKLPDFELLRREKGVVQGRDAVDLIFELSMEGNSVRQRQLYFVSNEGKKRVSNIVITASEYDFNTMKEKFNSIIGSLVFTM